VRSSVIAVLFGRCTVAVVLSVTSASAQPAATTPPDPAVGSRLRADVLEQLPTAGNLFSVIETTQAEAATDRFNSGGVNAGGMSHVVAFLGSRTQTRYRVGDVDIASASGGTPLLFPELAFWQRVEVTTAMMPTQRNANGLAIELTPLRPAAKWSATAEAYASNAHLVASPGAVVAAPIARLDGWGRGSVVASGPIGGRSGLLVGASLTSGNTFVRESVNAVHERATSAFTHLVVAPTTKHEIRIVGWMQAGRAAVAPEQGTNPPIDDVSTVHLQSTVEKVREETSGWRVVGGYTEHRRHTGPATAQQVVDRLIDGPVEALIRDVDPRERHWLVGAQLASGASARRPQSVIGVEYSANTRNARPIPEAVIGETLDGLPARLWTYSSPGIESSRRSSAFAAFASDRVHLAPAVGLEAGLRLEAVRGASDGGATSIEWLTWLPSARLRWDIGARLLSMFFTGYRRSANQLTFDLLERGDPAAAVGTVSRWDGAFPPHGTVVARVGPGTGGNPSFSAIDPDLERPHTDEFVVGVESRPTQSWRLQVTGIARREASLVNVVNIGVPSSSYRVFTIPDANADLAGTADDQLLPVYERLPDTFGRDRYLLTNADLEPATMGAVVVTAQTETPRLFMMIGATAAATVGPGSSRGFRGHENDQDSLGEIFSNPNASTYARGRLFSDRAYVVKWTTAYRFPRDIRLGVIARYQDGQPFSRIVIVPGLAQGPEAIQAFANGRSRFAFTGTLDVRLQKGFSRHQARVDLVLDVYNLLNMTKEVEEYVVSGPRFRTASAVQPPRAVHVGLRLKF
jgi:hypothetical protein